MSENIKFIDLCCGIGGFHQALGNLKMECVFASDIDKECRDIYEKNYKIKPEGDIKNIDIKNIPDFDILCAGFPCQPFSKAGKQKGFKDDRGNIFFNICEIITHHKPKYIILENVRNLASHDKGNTWKIIYEKINNMNYYTYSKPVILNTLYFGIPQSRERVVILCKRKDLGNLPELPTISKKNIIKTCLKSIIEENYEKNISKKLKITEKVWNEFLIILKKNNIVVPKFPLWTDWWDSNGDELKLKDKNEFYKKYKNWIDKNKKFYKENINILNKWLENSRKNPEWIGSVRKMEWQCKDNSVFSMNQVLWSQRGSGIRIKNIDYSPTLVAMASMIPIYGPKSRHLTTRECARLQSFPNNFIIHKDDKIAYKQFGNAVNVKMIEKCASFLIKNESLF